MKLVMMIVIGFFTATAFAQEEALPAAEGAPPPAAEHEDSSQFNKDLNDAQGSSEKAKPSVPEPETAKHPSGTSGEKAKKAIHDASTAGHAGKKKSTKKSASKTKKSAKKKAKSKKKTKSTEE